MAEKSIKAAQVQTLINNIKQRFFSKAEAQAISFMGETQEVDSKDVDSTPTAGSTNLVTSGGVKSAIDAVPVGTTNFEALSNRPKYGGNVMTKDTDIPVHDSSKQDTISDLSTIRSGASAGATAVQPSALNSYRTSSAQDQIDALKADKPDTYTKSQVDAKIPTVPTISTNIDSDKSSDAKTASPKAVYSSVHPATQSTIPSGGMLPNILYNLGTITGSRAMTLANPTDSTVTNHYFFTFDTGSTAPTITWDSKITKWNGGSAPTINANKHYEISVLNGCGVFMEV